MYYQVINLLASSDVITEISDRVTVDGAEKHDPEPADALADAADAPLGPQEIQDVLQFLTVAFTSGSAALVFFQNVISTMKSLEGKPEIKITDIDSGKIIATIDSESDASNIIEKLKL